MPRLPRRSPSGTGSAQVPLLHSRMQRAWLVKTEPASYAYEDLERDGRTMWDGVRNYQARNFMRDGMQVGDPVLVYHSGGSAPGVVGVAEVASAAYPDPTQFDPNDPHHDPKATHDAPRWFLVDLVPVRALPRRVTLAELSADSATAGMSLTKRGNRLSVMPVEPRHFEHVLALADRDVD